MRWDSIILFVGVLCFGLCPVPRALHMYISLSFSVSLSLILSLSCCYVFTLGLGCIDAASLSLLVLRSGPRIACSVCPSLPSLSSRCPWRTTCTGRGCNSRAMYLSSGHVLVAEIGVKAR